ncbi:protein-L-isoaspartate(D-aspartate) O-methyltransferase [Halofilum ochraceum]|uniref:protein-L-isoaspartate(D-aspartate) O-methyltransferase n=1 Tax=Halofilum ochraceum TaxID=1611323 RepID=UPI000ABFA643|nr:protein-L-isoaspartate(D-aspartate) O-methyltransferase [Halofilum ochraceum]
MDARDEMIETIVAETRATGRQTGRTRLNPRVLEALGAVPRDAFVPDDLADRAYDNRPLPIGGGQTISQPFIVALMTDLLDPEPGDRILEVGTGCGYQAAVLAQLVAQVYSIEYLPELARMAEATLTWLGYANIHLRTGNGREGWLEAAPFDGIIVTAGSTDVPPALVEQLAPGGCMVIPVGSGRMGQELLRITKSADGRVERQAVLPVAFVPLQHG